MNKSEYGNLLNTVERLKQFVDTNEKVLQNEILFQIMRLCSAGINTDVVVDPMHVLNVCNNGGFAKHISNAATNASTRASQKLAICKDEVSRLEASVTNLYEEERTYKQVLKHKNELQSRIEVIKGNIERYRKQIKDLDDSVAVLRSFGINVSRVDELNLENICATVKQKINEMEHLITDLKKLSDDLVAVNTSIDRSKIECAKRLLEVLDKNGKTISKLATDTRIKAEDMQKTISEEMENLKESEERLKAATVKLPQIRDMLAKYNEAFKVHKDENVSLYNTLRDVGATDFAQLRRQIESIGTQLDSEFAKYEVLLARLIAIRQEEIDATVAYIESQKNINLDSDKNDKKAN